MLYSSRRLVVTVLLLENSTCSFWMSFVGTRHSSGINFSVHNTVTRLEKVMKRSHAILASIAFLVLSTPSYGHHLRGYGQLGLCVYKHVPNSSDENQMYVFESKPYNSNCIVNKYTLHALFVRIPPGAPSGLYCSGNTFHIEARLVDYGCDFQHSYMGFQFNGSGGGSSIGTSGSLRFYAPPEYNRIELQDKPDKSLHMCFGAGDCESDNVKFHNGQTVYMVYDGDK